MVSKVLGTAFDLLDECLGNHDLAGFNVHVYRADLPSITTGGH